MNRTASFLIGAVVLVVLVLGGMYAKDSLFGKTKAESPSKIETTSHVDSVSALRAGLTNVASKSGKSPGETTESGGDKLNEEELAIRLAELTFDGEGTLTTSELAYDTLPESTKTALQSGFKKEFLRLMREKGLKQNREALAEEIVDIYTEEQIRMAIEFHKTAPWAQKNADTLSRRMLNRGSKIGEKLGEEAKRNLRGAPSSTAPEPQK